MDKEDLAMINWIALSGKIEVEEDSVKHIPLETADSLRLKTPPFTFARSNVQFESGTIKFEATLAEPTACCQLLLNHGLPSELYVGLNVLGASYGIARRVDAKYEPLRGCGYDDRPVIKKPISLEVKVSGSVIELFVNEVKVCDAAENIFNSQIAFFFQGNEEILVKNLRAESQNPKAFVVMQYTDEYNSLYNEVIEPTCKEFGFEVVRADDIYSSGQIIEDIRRSIREASVIIADITPNNANVFYEIGYAHGVGKPTIFLSDRKRDKLPFDI
ncbi:MAG: hypothetical protein KAT58_12210, partial [candidate division Zixibacteria bacterium]|nr:hypothetical protein [candidate division Zixibacteria bacterium]